MGIEAIPLVTSDYKGNRFETLQDMADAVNEKVGDGRYIGHMAVEASHRQESWESRKLDYERGYLILVDREPETSEASAASEAEVSLQS